MNFEDLTAVELSGKSPAQKNMPVLKQVDGIELRLLPPYIKDNRTAKVWPFPGLANLYCITVVVSDVENQLSCDMDLIAFPKVGDKELLPLNKTIYYWSRNNCDCNMPEQIHVMCALIKSKEKLRDIASLINQVKEDNDYNILTEKIMSVIAPSVTTNIITNFVLDLAQIVAKYLGHVNDRPVATIINSFTRLHGDWSRPGITPVLIKSKNVDFHLELIVRDNSFLKNKLLPDYRVDQAIMTKLF